MNKVEYLKEIDKLNLDKNEYCIISGGVMLLYNLRDQTEDIDIKVTKKLFNELTSRFNLTKSPKFSYLYELSNNIEIALMDFDKNDIVWIDGYPVESLEKQLEWKLSNNREKDKRDIKIIRNFLDSNKSS